MKGMLFRRFQLICSILKEPRLSDLEAAAAALSSYEKVSSSKSHRVAASMSPLCMTIHRCQGLPFLSHLNSAHAVCITPGSFYHVAEPSHVPGARGRQLSALISCATAVCHPSGMALGLWSQICNPMLYMHEDALYDSTGSDWS